MTAKGRDRTPGSRWLLLLLVALGALALAAPAAAQQEATINQSCNAGSDADGEDSGDSDSSGSGGDCGNQRRVIQQRGGGDVSRSVNQTQTFGDDDRVRSREDDDDDEAESRQDDQFETQEEGQGGDASASSEEDFDCEDFSSQDDAQAVLDEDSSDPFELDGDGDGRACDGEFSDAVGGAPEGGVETGGGGTLVPRLAGAEEPTGGLPDAALIAGSALALALIVGGLLGLRRGRAA